MAETQMGKIRPNWTYLLVIAIATLSLLLIPVFGQFGFGGSPGSATDPVPALLRSQAGIRQCYSFSGQLNNIDNPRWGAVGEPLIRPEGSQYEDDDWFNIPTGINARVISNVLSHETCADAARNSETCLNDWLWLWGQWIDHDMTHVPTFPRAPGNETVDISIPVAATDPFLGGRTLPLTRSLVDAVTNDQINLASSYIDSSQLYGPTVERADSIRTFRNGMLRMSQDGFMPVLSSRLNLDHSGTPTFSELGHPSNKDQFLCADMRCNQHAPMAVFQSLFVREHNRIASALAQSRHPAYNTDEAIYQAARACVIAENQAITYQEFLPLTFGSFNLAAYTGYKRNIRATVSNVFATAGFRMMHTMIGCDFKEMTANGQLLRSIPFALSFFDSTWIRGPPAQPNRIGRERNAYQTILNGLANNPSTLYDHKVSPGLRSVLFSGINTPTGRRPDVAFDVVSSDIQRGRDHGLLSYRNMRKAMGWKDITRIEDITLNAERVRILRSLYGDDVDKVDLMVGLMTEDQLEGSLLGPVTLSIIRDQFERSRDGDRCWFENQFTGELLNIFRNTKLEHVIQRNFEAPDARLASEAVQGAAPTRTMPGASNTANPRQLVPTPVEGEALDIMMETDDDGNIIPRLDQDGHPIMNDNDPLDVLMDQDVNGQGASGEAVIDELATREAATFALGGDEMAVDDEVQVGDATGDFLGDRPRRRGDRRGSRSRSEQDGNPDKRRGGEQGEGRGMRRGERRFEGDNGEGQDHMVRQSGEDGAMPHRRGRMDRPQGHHGSPHDGSTRQRRHIDGVDHIIPTDKENAQRRFREGRSSWDNGSGVREASPVDDVVGYRCNVEGCRPVALENDPEFDADVIELARQITRERRAQALLAQRGTTSSTAVPAEENPFMADLAALSPQGTTADTFGVQNRHAFTTMQVAPNTPAALRPRAPHTRATASESPTTTFIDENGQFKLMPSNQLTQTTQRQRVPTVRPQVLQNNVFVRPQCRT